MVKYPSTPHGVGAGPKKSANLARNPSDDLRIHPQAPPHPPHRVHPSTPHGVGAGAPHYKVKEKDPIWVKVHAHLHPTNWQGEGQRSPFHPSPTWGTEGKDNCIKTVTRSRSLAAELNEKSGRASPMR